MRLTAALLLALLPPAPALAQSAAPTAAVSPDAPRLTAAHQVIDVLFPPATRDRMMQGMMTQLMAIMQQGIAGNPQFTKAIGSDPRVKQLFDRFLDQETARALGHIRTSLPGMMDAMAKAYARRFDLMQLAQIKAFFETPTGQAYREASITIMSDPDVAAYQRSMMSVSMDHVQEDAADFARQVAALKEDRK